MLSCLQDGNANPSTIGVSENWLFKDIFNSVNLPGILFQQNYCQISMSYRTYEVLVKNLSKLFIQAYKYIHSTHIINLLKLQHLIPGSVSSLVMSFSKHSMSSSVPVWVPQGDPIEEHPALTLKVEDP